MPFGRGACLSKRAKSCEKIPKTLRQTLTTGARTATIEARPFFRLDFGEIPRNLSKNSYLEMAMRYDEIRPGTFLARPNRFVARVDLG